MGLSHLETRYLDSCRRQQMLPNSSILSSFSKAILQKSSQEKCSLEISLDQLVPSDFPPLIDAFLATNLYGIDAVDVRQESPGVLFPGEYVLSLFRAINQKLRVVDLFYCSFWKDILRVISISGMTCQVLNMRSSPIRRLNMSGNFMQLHTLNLDFSISLSSFWESCFSCMPNLLRLSMCETRIANLWMTSAALSKLPSLVELRFQNCSCCHDTGPCPTLSSGKAIAFDYEKIHSGLQHFYTYYGPPLASESFMRQQMHHSGTEDYNVFSDDEPFTNHELPQNSTEESSDESELDFLSSQQGTGNRSERLSDAPPELDLPDNLEIVLNQTGYYASVSSGSSVPTVFNHVEEDFCSRSINNIYEMNTVEDLHNNYQNGLAAVDELFDPLELDNQFSAGTPLTRAEQGCSADGLNEESDHALRSSDLAPKRRISHHPSPICFEKHYREYMITSLPRLKVLDNLPVKNMERDKAKIIFKQYYEYLPYSRQHKESVVSILQKREIGTSTILQKSSYLRQPCSSRQCNHSFSRSLSAAKVSSCPWPRLHTVSKFRSISREEIKSFRPRQFEYHPSNPSLMVFGTLDGELVVINHEIGKLVGYLPSVGALHSILGLCWLKNHPSKLIAGSDNGSLQLYDVCQMPSTLTDRYYSMDAATFSFDEFEQLTSVHVNSTDELLLASGFSKHVALYDIGSARRLQVFENLHREHINVVKFSHHSPSVFATASFDQEVKMWDLRQGTSQPCYTACSSRGNVMVCFSPDDHYLLSSAVDNEVKQLLAVDGRLHMEFNIASTGSAQNYTRSYYMNGRDYIISGSCEENVVRICCAQTGRRLRDISLEGRGSRKSMFVQSLRGDPFRVFHMSVLAAYLRPSSKSEIIKVNLLANGDCIENDSCVQHWRPSYCMGG